MYAKYAKSSDSDLTSLEPSSPRSPKRPVYYVQSPSRDSHDDGDKSATASSSSLPNTTPIDSPSHPYYHPGRHSRASSSSRVSGGSYPSSASATRKPTGKIRRWPSSAGNFHVILEEGGGDYDGYGDPARCRVLLAVMGLAAIFTAFCFLLWGASRPFSPQITVKSLTVHNFYFGQGSDLTGVPTKMLTTNCSVGIKVYNPASFFGISVSSTPVRILFSQLVVATGQLRSYYQPRKSHKAVSVNVKGMRVPLYGAGASLTRSAEEEVQVPVRLVFEVRSRGYVVGKLVKSRHTQRISCALMFDSRTSNPIRLKKHSCTYKLV
ncbi:unnamed protein product [Linum trigynum]|uniref:Late embryogenesis abundant protein LEA-2 subgroup domain-containing protein n=1 Tax=Linum trigynum TaxID=586398 RepID=A0AAV2GVI7_9ROSI